MNLISKIRNFAIHMCVCVAAGAITPACTDTSAIPVEPSDTAGLVEMGFHIRLSENYDSRSRADMARSEIDFLPSDYNDPSKYEAGTGYENYIDISGNDFRFILFDEAGKYLETPWLKGIHPTGDGEFPSEYTVICELKEIPAGTFKVVALVNWGAGNYPGEDDLVKGVTTIDDVCSANTFDYTPAAGSPFVPSTTTPIPMYGIKTCEHMTLTTGDVNDLGDLYLLRALAKVEVVCGQESGLELEKVTLDRFNNKGFFTPQGMFFNTTYVTFPHIPSDAVATSAASLDFVISENRDKAVIYIPEYRNTGDGNHCRLTITFTDNSERHYTVDFEEYSGGKPTGNLFDILRNCCYRFTVDKTPDFRVDVVPYGVSWLDPEFGLDAEESVTTE